MFIEVEIHPSDVDVDVFDPLHRRGVLWVFYEAVDSGVKDDFTHVLQGYFTCIAYFRNKMSEMPENQAK